MRGKLKATGPPPASRGGSRRCRRVEHSASISRRTSGNPAVSGNPGSLGSLATPGGALREGIA
eukprot:9350586-Pyramimonas_sp.AAC.1